MKYIASPSDFFNQQSLNSPLIKEDLAKFNEFLWQRISQIRLPDISAKTPQEEAAILEHQLFLLESFDTLEEANRHENTLIKYGYDPVVLTLEQGYFETYSAISAFVNETIGEFFSDAASAVGDFVSGAASAVGDAVSGAASAVGSFLGSAYDAVKSAVSGFGKLGKYVWDFLSLMTEGGSLIGIIQFILDIIGLIPASWVGFPIDIIANLINAVISFVRGNYLMGILNLVACADLSHIFGGIKALIKPFSKLFEPLGKLIWKGDVAATKAAAVEFKTGSLAIDASATAAKGPISMLGGALKSIGQFLAGTGIKIVRGFIDIISWTLNKVTFGLVSLPKGITKWLDELVLKIGGASKAAVEAGEILVKGDAKVAAGAASTAAKSGEVVGKAVSAEVKTAAEAARVEAETAAKAAGKSADEITKAGEAAYKDAIDAGVRKSVSAELKTTAAIDIKGLDAEIIAKIKGEPGWAKLMEKGASESVQNLYLKSAATERLVGNILAKDSASSVINILKNPEIAAELTKAGAKPAEKVLTDAIKAGDSAAIEKLFGEMLENPKVLQELAKHEPQIAKTVNLFKEAPDALIAGTKNLKSIQKGLAKFTGKLAYRGLSGRAFICFILKQFLKNYKPDSPCDPALTQGTPDDMLQKVQASADDKEIGIDIKEALAVLNLVSLNEGSDLEDAQHAAPGIDAKALEEFKESNPEGYAELMKSIKASNEKMDVARKKFLTKNPCSGSAAFSQAATGFFLTPNRAYNGKRERDLLTDADWEDSGLNEYTKGILKQLGQDANIDPQHPLSKTDAYTQAYFSDVYDFKNNSFDPNVTDTSRLDATIEHLQKEGIINSNQVADVKQATLKSWSEDSYPSGLTDILASFPKQNESIFKVGKLITIR